MVGQRQRFGRASSSLKFPLISHMQNFRCSALSRTGAAAAAATAAAFATIALAASTTATGRASFFLLRRHAGALKGRLRRGRRSFSSLDFHRCNGCRRQWVRRHLERQARVHERQGKRPAPPPAWVPWAPWARPALETELRAAAWLRACAPARAATTRHRPWARVAALQTWARAVRGHHRSASKLSQNLRFLRRC